jgi:hypothetical protein
VTKGSWKEDPGRRPLLGNQNWSVRRYLLRSMVIVAVRFVFVRGFAAVMVTTSSGGGLENYVVLQ